MFRALAQYVHDEAKPRWRSIVLTWECLIAVAVLVVFLKFGNRLFDAYPKVSDVSTGLIAYASIALGFCIAGLTISLTFPEPKFTLKLATPPHKGQKTNAYSDLLFVFSWTAIAHWFTVLVMFVVILLTDGSLPLIPKDHSRIRTWIVALIASLCAYCLCQFLITLITLSQVGSVYIKFLSQHRGTSEDHRHSPATTTDTGADA